MTRVLILTASVGEGHDLPARLLAERLRAEDPGAEVVVEDGLRAMGSVFVLLSEARRASSSIAPVGLGRGLLGVRGCALVPRLTRSGRPQVRSARRAPLVDRVARTSSSPSPDHHGGARRAAPPGAARGPCGRRDHRPGDDALLGGARDRPPPGDAFGVDRRGARCRRRGGAGRRGQGTRPARVRGAA